MERYRSLMLTEGVFDALATQFYRDEKNVTAAVRAMLFKVEVLRAID